MVKERRPQDWRAEEQRLTLQESHVLTGEALNAWCRERGIFSRHLTSWKTAFCRPQQAATTGLPDNRELRGLKDENEQLKREVQRGDQRPARIQTPKNQLTAAECALLLVVANSDEFAHLPPSQIVPRLADQGRYLASESSLYRVLRAAKQLKHRGSARPATARSKPRPLSADAPNQLFSWEREACPRGASLICRRRSGVPTLTCIFLWIFLAVKWWEGATNNTQENSMNVTILGDN